jgi:putative transposase
VVKPPERRVVTRWMVEACRVSLRKACRASGSAMSSMTYHSVRPDQARLKTRMREIAMARVSYGYRRVLVLLRREGWRVNLKWVLLSTGTQISPRAGIEISPLRVIN